MTSRSTARLKTLNLPGPGLSRGLSGSVKAGLDKAHRLGVAAKVSESDDFAGCGKTGKRRKRVAG